MSAREPMEVVRDVNRAWAARPFETARGVLLASSDWDDAVRRFEEAGLQTDPIDPDVEVVVDAFPDVLGLIDQEQVGDYVVAEAHSSARTRNDDVLIEMTLVQLFKVRDGLIAMYGVYPNRDDALAAIHRD